MKSSTHTLKEETEKFRGKIVEKVCELEYEDYPDDTLICIKFTDGSRLIIDAILGEFDESNECNNEYPLQMYCRFKEKK